MQTVDVPIGQLKFSEYNPRSMSAHDFEGLKRSLREFGWVEPAVVNTSPGRENVIIGGHQRVRAAQALGQKTVPVVFVHVPPAQEKLLNLALNRISGQWDEDR
ncbi:MAG: ParB N-terminal domain-containing protein, partial [Nitrospirota bacterium]